MSLTQSKENADLHEQILENTRSIRWLLYETKPVSTSTFVGQIAPLLRRIEERIPELAATAAVDFLVRSTGIDADLVVQEAARYFGNRQNVHASNSLYYIGTPHFYIDEQMFEMVWGHKIQPGGYFVLIESFSSSVEAQLAPLVDEEVELSDHKFRFRVWCKPRIFE